MTWKCAKCGLESPDTHTRILYSDIRTDIPDPICVECSIRADHTLRCELKLFTRLKGTGPQ